MKHNNEKTCLYQIFVNTRLKKKKKIPPTILHNMSFLTTVRHGDGVGMDYIPHSPFPGHKYLAYNISIYLLIKI